MNLTYCNSFMVWEGTLLQNPRSTPSWEKGENTKTLVSFLPWDLSLWTCLVIFCSTASYSTGPFPLYTHLLRQLLPSNQPIFGLHSCEPLRLTTVLRLCVLVYIYTIFYVVLSFSLTLSSPNRILFEPLNSVKWW